MNVRGFTTELRRDATDPLHLQIQRGIRLAIARGDLRPLDPLPPVKSLAAQLGVNRLTVLKALSSLRGCGAIVGRRGRGYTVADNPLQRLMGTSEWRPSKRYKPLMLDAGHAHAEARWSEAALVPPQPSELISFAAGAPATDFFPVAELKRLTAKMFGKTDPRSFGYARPEGMPELREQLVARFQRRGVDLNGLELLITSGAQQALDLLARSIQRRSGIVLTESPTYFGGLAAFERGGFAVEGSPLDAGGINVDALDGRLRRRTYDLLYVIPAFHNPTGLTTGEARRQELLRLAVARDLLVVEDDAFGEMRFTGKPARSLLELRGAAKVLQIGSFSKSLMPGLRIGWVLGPPEIIGPLKALKATDDTCSSTISQMIAAHYLASGAYDRHLRRIRRAYRGRCTAMVSAIRRYFPERVRHTVPKGGIHVWAVLPEHLNAVNLLPLAMRAGADYLPGPIFFPAGRSGTNCLRLNFSTHGAEQIDRGMQILGELFRRALTT